MMSIRFAAVLLVLLLLVGGTGVVMGDSHDNGSACPSENPNQGAERSIEGSDSTSLVRASGGLGEAYASVGCPE